MPPYFRHATSPDHIPPWSYTSIVINFHDLTPPWLSPPWSYTSMIVNLYGHTVSCSKPPMIIHLYCNIWKLVIKLLLVPSSYIQQLYNNSQSSEVQWDSIRLPSHGVGLVNEISLPCHIAEKVRTIQERLEEFVQALNKEKPWCPGV